MAAEVVKTPFYARREPRRPRRPRRAPRDELPDDLKYTKEHEWAGVEGRRAVVGITDFAQDQLGDIVYVELPRGRATW